MVDPCLLMKTVHTQTDPKVQLQTTNPKVQLQTTNPKVQLQLQGITPDRHIHGSEQKSTDNKRPCVEGNCRPKPIYI